MSVTSSELREAVAALPNYPEWCERQQEHAQTEQELAEFTGTHRVQGIRLTLANVEAEEALKSQQGLLAADIAESGTLPTVQKIGLLEAIHGRHAPRLNTRLPVIAITELRLAENEDIPLGARNLVPPRDAYERAALITDAISTYNSELKNSARPARAPVDSEGWVFMASLSLGRMRTNLSYPTLADYHLANPTLQITNPVVQRDALGTPEVHYELPFIASKEAVRPSQLASDVPIGTTSDTKIKLPIVEQLAGISTVPRRLLFGRAALEFARKHHQDRLNEQRRIQQLAARDAQRSKRRIG